MGNSASTLSADHERTSETNQVDNGWRCHITSRDLTPQATTMTCFYCCPKQGKEHPLEQFASLPCCGYKLCLKCIRSRMQEEFCLECISRIPAEERAISFLQGRAGLLLPESVKHHLLGRAFVLGVDTRLDELVPRPLYQRLEPTRYILLAFSNPPMVARGVYFIEKAAESGNIAASLDLADIYCSEFLNDPFEKDIEKAEYWFRRSVGNGNVVCPLALTRYGLFLQHDKCDLVSSKQMFQIAAHLGHAPGQYEYAACLLGGIGKSEDDPNVGKCTSEDTSEAVEWLCKASLGSSHAPSLLRLGITLIDVFEEQYGTSKLVPAGKSPLPRALQTLKLVQEASFGISDSISEKATKLLERYNSNKVCSHCGDKGSPHYPLRQCATCGVVSYCSQLCSRKHFRDGHHFDCCSPDEILDPDFTKLSLPWVRKLTDDELSKRPVLQTQTETTLKQMVEDDTDEVCGDVEPDYDDFVLAQLMQRMRINLESFLEQHLISARATDSNGKSQKCDTEYPTLKKRIEQFVKLYGPQPDFVDAMHRIREYGNLSSHHSLNQTMPSRLDCERAVSLYRNHKQSFRSALPSNPRISKKIPRGATSDEMEKAILKEVCGGIANDGDDADAAAPTPAQQVKKTKPKKKQKKRKKKNHSPNGTGKCHTVS